MLILREGVKGILAGLCISIGGSVFLACDNRYVGAVLFCVALMTICMFGFSLYTGKIGYIIENHGKRDIIALLSGLFGNVAGCIVFGLLIRVGLPSLAGKAELICSAKLTETVPEALIRAFFCGVLMYIAVWIYKNKKTPLGIFVCIPVFILSGFEHSVANMFYFFAAFSFSGQSILYLLIIVAGNTLGSWIIPLLEKITKEKVGNV